MRSWLFKFQILFEKRTFGLWFWFSIPVATTIRRGPCVFWSMKLNQCEWEKFLLTVFIAAVGVEAEFGKGSLRFQVRQRKGERGTHSTKGARVYCIAMCTWKFKWIVATTWIFYGSKNTSWLILDDFVRAHLTAEWLSNILSRGCKSFFSHISVSDLFSSMFCLSKLQSTGCGIGM